MDREARSLAVAWGVAALLLCGIAPPAVEAAQPRSSLGRVIVRWLGQDGQDFVGPNNRLEPSDVQDIHLQLTGLDPAREIDFVDVTGQGGDQWHFNQQSFAWKAALKRTRGARLADLFIEPARVESGRTFQIVVRYQDGRTQEASFRGGVASPRVRMPEAKLAARWVGQDGSDWASTGPSVGPDGLQDVRLQVSGISAKVAVRTLLIEDNAGTRWEFGVNPQAHHNAELVLDTKKPSEGNLYFQPTQDMEGRKLKLSIQYVNETVDSCVLSAAGCRPDLATPSAPMPAIEEGSLGVKWLGQEAQTPAGPGAVHLRLGGLARDRQIVAAVLTDSVQGSWVFHANQAAAQTIHADDFSEPLAVQAGGEAGASADVYFAPYRDEAGANLTLRLVLDDGSMRVARFAGNPCDPGKRIPRPSGPRVEVKPGDDLQEIANRAGTVALGPGVHRLSRPLVLENPVTITSDGEATLLFSQGPQDAPWTTAIKVHRGHTTLDHFKVRFEGPIRWKDEIVYGPAVIGATDNFDVGHSEPKFNLTFTRLDLEIPPAENPQGWIEAVRLMRLRNARSGFIAGNTLRGGPIEFFDGPWRIENNRSYGTVPGTVSSCIFAGHLTHDLILKGNWAESPPPCGKTWRFLVLTVKGTGDLIAGNTIKGIGPRDDDTIPWANSPETMLTEAYQVTYEGIVRGLSQDRRVLRIGQPQGYPAQTGSMVAILDGPGAGTAKKIAQAIDPATYLLDEPIPAEIRHVSIARGFVNETFERNTIDTRGGMRALNFLFAGNHYGTRLIKNHSLGAQDAFRLVACATESPRIWGWSHAPFFGCTIADNIFEDSARGGIVGVEHDPKSMKTTRGRVYMSGRVDRNLFRWSAPFYARFERSRTRGLPVGLTIGIQPTLDPHELRIDATGNKVEVPSGSPLAPILSIPAAEFNGRRIVEGKFRLPGDPTLEGANSPARSTDASRSNLPR